MPVIQDVFSTEIPVGYPGMVANGETSNRISRTIEDAGGLPFGRAAFRGAGDHGCTATPSADFLGIAIADHGLPIFPGGLADTYPQYATVPLMNEGVIWVLAAGNVTDGDPVTVDAEGDFVAGGATAIAGWTFDGTAASGAMVRISNKRNT